MASRQIKIHIKFSKNLKYNNHNNNLIHIYHLLFIMNRKQSTKAKHPMALNNHQLSISSPTKPNITAEQQKQTSKVKTIQKQQMAIEELLLGDWIA